MEVEGKLKKSKAPQVGFIHSASAKTLPKGSRIIASQFKSSKIKELKYNKYG